MNTLLHITIYTRDGVESKLSGIRATTNGYTPIRPYTIEGTVGYSKDMRYSGIFFTNGTHMTYEYSANCSLPVGYRNGDSANVTVIGEYHDDDVSCLIVRLGDLTHQPTTKHGRCSMKKSTHYYVTVIVGHERNESWDHDWERYDRKEKIIASLPTEVEARSFAARLYRNFRSKGGIKRLNARKAICSSNSNYDVRFFVSKMAHLS
jgi:hypothetical protein